MRSRCMMTARFKGSRTLGDLHRSDDEVQGADLEVQVKIGQSQVSGGVRRGEEG